MDTCSGIVMTIERACVDEDNNVDSLTKKWREQLPCLEVKFMSACYTQVKLDCGESETSTWERERERERETLVAEVGPTNLNSLPYSDRGNGRGTTLCLWDINRG